MTTIGFVPPALDHTVTHAMIRGLVSTTAARGGQVLVVDGGLDVGRQVEGIERLVAVGVDALVVYPAGDPRSLHRAIDDAVARGVRIFAHDDLGHDAVEAEMVTPVEVMGSKAADLLAGALGGVGSIAVVTGVDAPAVTDRVNGFLERIESAHPEINVVATALNSFDDADGAKAAVAKLLKEEPTLEGIFAYNDSSAVGTARAVAAAGRTPLIVGNNGEPHGIAAVADGVIAGTVDRHPVELAQRTAELILDILERPRKPGPAESVLVEPTAVTSATIGEFVPWNERCATPPDGSWHVVDA